MLLFRKESGYSWAMDREKVECSANSGRSWRVGLRCRRRRTSAVKDACLTKRTEKLHKTADTNTSYHGLLNKLAYCLRNTSH